jgi:hypothetical protein
MAAVAMGSASMRMVAVGSVRFVNADDFSAIALAVLVSNDVILDNYTQLWNGLRVRSVVIMDTQKVTINIVVGSLVDKGSSNEAS